MTQGTCSLKRAAPKSGGRNTGKKGGTGQMRKGNLIRKPKKQQLARAHNQKKKLSAAIGRNIERATGKMVMTNGGDLSVLKRVSKAAKDGGDETSSKATAPKFDTRKQFRLTS